MVVRVQPETCEYFENEIPAAGRHENGFHLYVRIPWRALDSIPRLYFVGTLANCGLPERPSDLRPCSTTRRNCFLLPKQKILNRKIRSRLPAVEIRKSIVCNTIEMTMWEEEKKRSRCARACMRRPSHDAVFYSIPLFVHELYLLWQFYFRMEFIFIAALRLIHLLRSYWNIT